MSRIVHSVYPPERQHQSFVHWLWIQLITPRMTTHSNGLLETGAGGVVAASWEAGVRVGLLGPS